jgi:hypothetical protein
LRNKRRTLRQARRLLAIAAMLDGASRAESGKDRRDGLADAARLGDPVQQSRAERSHQCASPGAPPKLDATHLAFFAGFPQAAGRPPHMKRFSTGRSYPGGRWRGAMAGLRSDHATARGVRRLGIGRHHLSCPQKPGLLTSQRPFEGLSRPCRHRRRSRSAVVAPSSDGHRGERAIRSVWSCSTGRGSFVKKPGEFSACAAVRGHPAVRRIHN